jgi:hypothetical protein
MKGRRQCCSLEYLPPCTFIGMCAPRLRAACWCATVSNARRCIRRLLGFRVWFELSGDGSSGSNITVTIGRVARAAGVGHSASPAIARLSAAPVQRPLQTGNRTPSCYPAPGQRGVVFICRACVVALMLAIPRPLAVHPANTTSRSLGGTGPFSLGMCPTLGASIRLLE